MAPKAMKRPAAAAVEESPKRQAVASSPRRRGRPSRSSADAASFKTIAKEIKDSTLPDSVRELLVNMMPHSLGLLKEERHGFQNTVVGMIRDTLGTVEAAIQDCVKEAEAKVAELAVEKNVRDALLSSAEGNVTAKTEALTAKKQALNEAREALKLQEKALAGARTTQVKGDFDLEAAAGKKEKLESAEKEMYTPLKEGTVPKEELKTAIAALVAVGKEFSLDQSLLNSVPAAISKEVSARGAFDTMVLNSFEGAVAKELAALSQTLESGAAGKAERAAAVESAEKVHETAEGDNNTCITNLQTAQSELKEAEAALKEAKSQVKAYKPTADSADKDCEDEKERLTEFQEGALASFKELEARTAPLPPPSEELPDAEQAPAEGEAE